MVADKPMNTLVEHIALLTALRISTQCTHLLLIYVNSV